MVGSMEVLPQLVFAHEMEKIICKGYMVWDVAYIIIKGKITSNQKGEITPLDEILKVLERHQDIFGDMPSGQPP